MATSIEEPRPRSHTTLAATAPMRQVLGAKWPLSPIAAQSLNTFSEDSSWPGLPFSLLVC